MLYHPRKLQVVAHGVNEYSRYRYWLVGETPGEPQLVILEKYSGSTTSTQTSYGLDRLPVSDIRGWSL